MIKLVVFDWNGTLIADTLACMDADNHVLKTFGGRPVDLKTYRETIIIPAIDFYVQHGCNREELIRESKKLGEVFHTYYEPRVLKVRTRSRVREMLNWLAEQAIESVILSNHTVSGIQSQLERLKIKKYFSSVLANDALDASMKGRNKQEKLEVYFKNSGFLPSEVLIVGDSPEEVEMGKHIGIYTVAITNGYYSTARLVKAGPSYLIHNMGELIQIIEKMK